MEIGMMHKLSLIFSMEAGRFSAVRKMILVK